jgi:hypothetical protein
MSKMVKKNAIIRPPTLVFVKMLFKKMTTLSARPPFQKIHQGVAKRVPLLFVGVEGGGSPPHRQENFGLVRGYK